MLKPFTRYRGNESVRTNAADGQYENKAFIDTGRGEDTKRKAIIWPATYLSGGVTSVTGCLLFRRYDRGAIRNVKVTENKKRVELREPLESETVSLVIRKGRLRWSGLWIYET